MKINVSSPISRAASSAHKSGPLQPPETITEFPGSDFTVDFTDLDDMNFLDPINPTFMEENPIIQTNQKSSLHHHRRSFMGCFSCVLRKDIDYSAFQRWKDNPEKQKTLEIAEKMVQYISNYYDFITTAPPSKNRNLSNYCAFKLAETISEITKIPFIITFQQRNKKANHGRFESIKAELPVIVPGWEHTKESILFIDDFITSGTTARTCYDAMRAHNNHVDGLIYCQF